MSTIVTANHKQAKQYVIGAASHHGRHGMSLSLHTRDRLAGVATANIANALLQRGLRNTYLLGVQPIAADQPRLVGPAVAPAPGERHGLPCRLPAAHVVQRAHRLPAVHRPADGGKEPADNDAE